MVGPLKGSTIPLAAEPMSVRRARAELRRRAGAELPPDVVDDAELLVSELVTNAILHGGGNIQLSIESGNGALTVGVYDSGGGRPAAAEKTDGPAGPSGRGLQMLARMATVWGIEEDPVGGKTVWFSLGQQAPVSDPARSGSKTSPRERGVRDGKGMSSCRRLDRSSW